MVLLREPASLVISCELGGHEVRTAYAALFQGQEYWPVIAAGTMAPSNWPRRWPSPWVRRCRPPRSPDC